MYIVYIKGLYRANGYNFGEVCFIWFFIHFLKIEFCWISLGEF